jgi:dipeptidyl aminopeptidase/acylaminoacyl peptidase
MLKRILRLMAFALLCFTLFGFAGLAFIAYVQATSLVYPAGIPVRQTPASVGVTDYREVSLTSADGTQLAAWYVPPPTDSPGPALVYVHGIGSNREHWLSELPLLYEAGYGGLLLDLRNHGDSGGDKTTMGLREAEDILAAFTFLTAQPEVDPERVMLAGDSLGGSSALLAAAAEPGVRAVVAVSPYSSLLGVVGDRARSDFRLPPRPAADMVVGWANQLSGESLYDADVMAAVPALTDRPLWLVHGEADPVTPVTSTLRLADAFEEAGASDLTVWVVPGAGHSGMRYDNPAEFQRRFLAFVERVLS